MLAAPKCCIYPQCVGHTAIKWIWSPIGMNILSFIIGDTSANMWTSVNILKNLQYKKQYLTESKFLYQMSSRRRNVTFEIPGHQIHCKDVVNLDETAGKILNEWVCKFGNNFECFDIENNILLGSDHILANVSTYNSAWSKGSPRGRTMTVYNVYSYAQDTQYEPRLLQLDTVDKDFKLVFIIPDQADILHCTFKKLVNDGFEEALNSIMPIFKSKIKWEAPCFEISSQTEFKLNSSHFCGTNIQYGTVKIDEVGIKIETLTCLYSCVKIPPPKESLPNVDKKPIFFVVLFKDYPIYAGQFLK